MTLYEVNLQVEKLENGGDYQFIATSPDLPNLIVVGDTPDEVLALAPQVASALIASMKAAGDPLPETLHRISELPFKSRVAVLA